MYYIREGLSGVYQIISVDTSLSDAWVCLLGSCLYLVYLNRTQILVSTHVCCTFDDCVKMKYILPYYPFMGGVLFLTQVWVLSITQVTIYSSSYLIRCWFPLLNFYLNLTRKQKFSYPKTKISSWVDFHLSNTHLAWIWLRYPPCITVIPHHRFLEYHWQVIAIINIKVYKFMKASPPESIKVMFDLMVHICHRQCAMNVSSTHCGLNYMIFCRRHVYLRNTGCWYFVWNYFEVCLRVKLTSSELIANGFITWNDDDPIPWRIYASAGHNVFKGWQVI